MSKIAISEFIATAFLLIAVVGSGIAADRLSGGNVGVALLANAVATGCALFVLIVVFAPLSGAHMNPVVTIAASLLREIEIKVVPIYVAAQIAGAIFGVMMAHAIFDLPVLQISAHVRTGTSQWLAEAVATFGLLGAVWGTRAHGLQTTAASVALYITGAYWFTASTSFANPAVTVARALTDTFAGIRPADAPGFVLAQVGGMILVLPVLRWLSRK